MKLLKFGLHFWITVTSMLSFLVGWIMLAHSPKPRQANSSIQNNVTQIPTLEPLAPLSDFNSNGNNFQSAPFLSVQPQPRSRHFFATGGS